MEWQEINRFSGFKVSLMITFLPPICESLSGLSPKPRYVHWLTPLPGKCMTELRGARS